RLGLWLSIALLGLGLLPVVCIGFALYAFERRRQHDYDDAAASAAPSGRQQAPVGEAQHARHQAGATSSLGSRWKSKLLPERGRGIRGGAGVLLAGGSLVAFFSPNPFFVNRLYAGVVVALVLLVTLASCLAAATNPITNRESADGSSHFAARWWAIRQSWL